MTNEYTPDKRISCDSADVIRQTTDWPVSPHSFCHCFATQLLDPATLHLQLAAAQWLRLEGGATSGIVFFLTQIVTGAQAMPAACQALHLPRRLALAMHAGDSLLPTRRELARNHASLE